MNIRSPDDVGESRRLSTIADVAKLFQVSPKTVEKSSFLRRIGLTKIKLGRAVRFDPDDVEKAIERARCPGCGDDE